MLHRHSEMRNSPILVGLAAVGFAACASASHINAPARRTTAAETPAVTGSSTIAGRVRNREAGPAPYALVTAIAAEPDADAPLMHRTRCDDSGRFTFNHLAAGSYSFFAMSAASQPAYAGSTLAMPVDGALAVTVTLDQPSPLQ